MRAFLYIGYVANPRPLYATLGSATSTFPFAFARYSTREGDCAAINGVRKAKSGWFRLGEIRDDQETDSKENKDRSEGSSGAYLLGVSR